MFLPHTSGEGLPSDISSPEYAKMHAEYTAAVQVIAKAGVLLDCAPLRPDAVATTLVECADLDEAGRWLLHFG